MCLEHPDSFSCTSDVLRAIQWGALMLELKCRNESVTPRQRCFLRALLPVLCGGAAAWWLWKLPSACRQTLPPPPRSCHQTMGHRRSAQHNNDIQKIVCVSSLSVLFLIAPTSTTKHLSVCYLTHRKCIRDFFFSCPFTNYEYNIDKILTQSLQYSLNRQERFTQLLIAGGTDMLSCGLPATRWAPKLDFPFAEW